MKHRQGDSDFEIKGWPSVASRSTITAGSAVVRTIDVMVSRLRKRLGDDAREPTLIKTVRNEGYLLAAKVERLG